jgi:hypothetical protein
VANRSSADEPAAPETKVQRGFRSLRPDDSDGAEFTVHLKVGYKTVLLVVVIFDLVHLSIREIYSSGFAEQVLSALF